MATVARLYRGGQLSHPLAMVDVVGEPQEEPATR